jgi:hypothetical protein
MCREAFGYRFTKPMFKPRHCGQPFGLIAMKRTPDSAAIVPVVKSIEFVVRTCVCFNGSIVRGAFSSILMGSEIYDRGAATRRRTKLCGCLLLACLLAGRAFPAEAYLPLRSDAPGHVSDLVLIYQGGVNRLNWNHDEISSYVTWKEPGSDKEEWLFDGFLYIEFRDARGRDYASGYGGEPARQTEWRWLLERNFSQTNALGALNEVIGEAAKRIGAPPTRRKVVLTLPEPIHGQTNWGTIGGRMLDFNLAADRIAACEWHMDQARELWKEAKFEHLELAGFYWVAERASKAQDILPVIANEVRKRGYRFYWIPYWNAAGAAQWRELGFDFAWQQPNHFFHPDKVPDSRLGEATAFARKYGMGLEFEADGRAIRNVKEFRPRFYEYLNAFARDGVKTGASVAYYEGGGALLQMARSSDPEVRAMYDTLSRWVAERQRPR